MALSIAIAQLNFMVGDTAGNAQKIIDAAQRAYAQGARLLLTPELSICGYAAEDLLLRPSFLAACDDAVKTVATALAGLEGLAVVVGHPGAVPGARPPGGAENGGARCFNLASVLRHGRIEHSYAKRELPNYQVFDELRYFAPGNADCVFEIGAGTDALRVGLLICEDAWFEAPARLAQQAGAELLAVINASPFYVGKGGERVAHMAGRARANGLPLVYAHLVGAQDELVFDGASFALHADGTLALQAAAFQEKLVFLPVKRAQSAIIFDFDTGVDAEALAHQPAPLSPEAELWAALVLGLRDYVEKNGFPSVLLGLSGGIDSALVLALAVDALGPQRVRCLMLASPYSAEISLLDARAMAQGLGVRYDEMPIAPLMEAFRVALAHEFQGLPEDSTEENLQARIRGVLLMALSNKGGAMVLTTGNKSELATGYCTLYGDMAGGFAALKDVSKTRVFALARWRNANDPFGRGSSPIPERTITRPPSAELRPDQTDQDSLPPYAVLDAIIERYVEQDQALEQIVAAGFERSEVERVLRLIRINEYKRRQAPVGSRVTPRGFGKDWRYPMSNRFRN